jgi:predicted O-methyltransferase YrrM
MAYEITLHIHGRTVVFLTIGCLMVLAFYYQVVFNLQGVNTLKRSQSPLPLLLTRDELVYILRNESFKTGAEVGVQTGAYSQYLLSNWPTCTEFHCIDLWTQQKHYNDSANVNNVIQESFYTQTRERLKKWENIVHYHRNYSSVAVNDLKDESMDFIYIDARHDYTGVTEDLKLYWQKLKYGGLLAGHDFFDAHEIVGQDWGVDQNGVHQKDGKAVKSAVIEFAAIHNRQVLRTLQDWPSWYFRK